jgi:hypothetical protein
VPKIEGALALDEDRMAGGIWILALRDFLGMILPNGDEVIEDIARTCIIPVLLE